MKLLEKAIQMEVDAGEYYIQQASKNQGTPVENAFIMLAKEEKKHEDILGRFLSDPTYMIDESQFADSEQFLVRPDDFKVEAGYTADQLEVYRVAMEMEQKMIELYRDMEKETTDSKALLVLGFLIRQEERHYSLFDSLEKLVRRPVDWVEAAEFGEREEY
ncbi:MAG: ferritin family protein [Eubacteriales bacterium]|jgi:rubrerythrin|nr:ferritin family protein [Eubacteriales bacterium]